MHNLLAVISAVALFFANSAFAVSADSGKTSYASNCASCHGVPSSPWNVSATTIQSAIQGNRGGMARLTALTASELQDIAAYLANPAATAVATGSAPTTSTPSTTTDTSTSTTPTATTGSTTASSGDDERIFEWSGSQLYGSRTPSKDIGGYYATFYPQANVYLGTKDGQLYFYDVSRPGDGLLSLGATSEWRKKVSASSGTATPGTEHDSETHENHHGAGHDD